MTTDNRTNEPIVDALLSQIESARVLAGLMRAWDVSPEQLEKLRSTLESVERCAALVAAQGAAPQAESVWVPGYGGTGVNKAARPVNGFDTTAERVKNGADSLHVAPVLPSSGIDEDALAEVINAALDKWEGYEPSVVFVARAVAAWLKDGAQA